MTDITIQVGFERGVMTDAAFNDECVFSVEWAADLSDKEIREHVEEHARINFENHCTYHWDDGALELFLSMRRQRPGGDQ